MKRRLPPLPVGWHRGVPMLDYLSFDAWSKGDCVVAVRQTLAHVQAYRERGDEPSDKAEFGTAVHCAVLEPELFHQGYAILPEGDGRTAAVRDAKKAIEASGKTPISKDDYEGCVRIRKLLGEHPIVGPALKRKDGVNEVTGIFKDPETGLVCRMRPDRRLPGLHIDLKTARDVSARAFNSSIHAYGYHVGAAFYGLGERALGGDLQDFVYVAIENEWPYLARVARLTDEAWETGRRIVRRGLQRIADAIAKHGERPWPLTWPDDLPGEGIGLADIPPYGHDEAQE